MIDNSAKVKEFLKDPDVALDAINNKCLFGEKFEEKRPKDTNAKLKSKLLFSGLQRKLNITGNYASTSGSSSYQPFLGGPLSQHSGEGTLSEQKN